MPVGFCLSVSQHLCGGDGERYGDPGRSRHAAVGPPAAADAGMEPCNCGWNVGPRYRQKPTRGPATAARPADLQSLQAWC